MVSIGSFIILPLSASIVFSAHAVRGVFDDLKPMHTIVKRSDQAQNDAARQERQAHHQKEGNDQEKYPGVEADFLLHQEQYGVSPACSSSACCSLYALFSS